MDVRFAPHNTHHEEPNLFNKNDPHLRELSKLVFVHRSHLLKEIPVNETGIFTVVGTHQVGKTTLMKQWMSDLMQKSVLPEDILYMTGELIHDHHTLVRLVMEVLEGKKDRQFCYLLLDDACYIQEWDKGIKYLADAGLLENVAMVLSGSDLSVTKDARSRFPGRRGKAETVDFNLFPLNFQETVRLKKRFTDLELTQILNKEIMVSSSLVDTLFEEFNLFLTHGGFLRAINDIAHHQRILPSTFSTYSDWIRSDFYMRGKKERYLREVLEVIIKRYRNNVTWNSLGHDLSIDHPKTIADYIGLLESMNAVYVQGALSESLLVAAPKKARKIIFTDPFIFHAVNSWLRPDKDPYTSQVLPLLSDGQWVSRLAAASVTGILQRYFPTYYIKAKGEIDIAYVKQQRFWPLGVNWGQQFRSKDLKQISTYTNGYILSKIRQPSEVMGIPLEPLPLALFRISN